MHAYLLSWCFLFTSGTHVCVCVHLISGLISNSINAWLTDVKANRPLFPSLQANTFFPVVSRLNMYTIQNANKSLYYVCAVLYIIIYFYFKIFERRKKRILNCVALKICLPFFSLLPSSFLLMFRLKALPKILTLQSYILFHVCLNAIYMCVHCTLAREAYLCIS